MKIGINVILFGAALLVSLMIPAAQTATINQGEVHFRVLESGSTSEPNKVDVTSPDINSNLFEKVKVPIQACLERTIGKAPLESGKIMINIVNKKTAFVESYTGVPPLAQECINRRLPRPKKQQKVAN